MSDDSGIIADLEAKQKASAQVRRRFEPQWFLNVAFYSGQQWIGYDGNRLFEPKLEEWRAKIVDNRIMPAVRTEIAKMTKTRPQWVGVPRDGSEDEITAARLREQAFEHEWGDLDATRKLRSALLWSRVCGAGFWKETWDKTLGPATDVLIKPDGTVLKDTYGKPITPDRAAGLPPEIVEGLQTRKVAMGAARLDVRTPFEIYPDPLAGDDGLESAEWLIEEAVYSKTYLIGRYGEKARDLTTDANPAAGISEGRMPIPGATQKTGGDDYQGVRVREYWCKPNADHPNGKHIVWAQSTVLSDGPNPYPWLPYVMFRGIPVPGRFWPSSVTEQLVPQNTALNKVESQIAENAERIGNPPLIRSAASGDEDTEWHGLPGEEIVFQDLGTPGSVPQFLQVPELPGYVQAQINRIENSIREISRQYEASTGSVPAGVTAASAINLLMEAGDTALAPDIEDMELAIQGAGRRVLWLLSTYCSEERLMRISGDDGAWEMVRWNGDKLGDGDLDEVQTGSGIPQSKAAKQAAIQQTLLLLIQNGVQIPQRDLRRIFRDFEGGALEHFFASLSRDEQQINDEHRRLLSGEQLTINSYDNNELHVEGHQEFQKTRRYAELARTPSGAAIQMLFQAHVDEHKAKLADQAAAMAPVLTPGVNGAGPPPPSLPSPAQPSTTG